MLAVCQSTLTTRTLHVRQPDGPVSSCKIAVRKDNRNRAVKNITRQNIKVSIDTINFVKLFLNFITDTQI